MKKPKRPKRPTWPKQPSMSSSIEVWKRWESKVMAKIEAYTKKYQDYLYALQAVTKVKDEKEEIKNKVLNAKESLSSIKIGTRKRRK